MTYALDSNIVSLLLRPNHNPDVVRRLGEAIQKGCTYVIPPLCYYEVKWNLIWKHAEVQTRLFNDLIDRSVSNFIISEAETVKSAEIRAYLEKRGTPIGEDGNGDADIFIAAHCLINGYTLVTDNVKDFSKIDGLRFVNWKERG